MISPDLVRLLLRAGPFAAARRDIGDSPLPGGQEVGAYHSFSDKKGGEPFLVMSFRVSTIGGLVRMWDNFMDLSCPSCGGRAFGRRSKPRRKNSRKSRERPSRNDPALAADVRLPRGGNRPAP